jgi:hypothetical protein
VSRKVFVAGEILTAADVNTNLMDQAVMSFAGTAARGSAIPSPVEGMATYLEDSNIFSLYDGSAWKTSLGTTGGILQVVQATKTDTFTTTSTSFTTVTGLTVSITPKSTSSRIIVLAQIAYGLNNGASYGHFKVTRGGTDIYVGNASSNRVRTVFGGYSQSNQNVNLLSDSIMFVDSPASVASLTYQVETRRGADSATVHVNRSVGDSDDANSARGASSITVMEVAG